jgi:hypothetical protein
MKTIFSKNTLLNLTPILVILLIVLARGLNAFSPGMSFSAQSGDGLSTMAWMNEIIQTYKEFGFSHLMTPIDLIVPTGSGGGLTTPNTFYHFWKFLFIGLADFLTLDNIYDVILLVGIGLTGIATYVLSLSFQMSRSAALITALFALSIENIDRRLLGHMFLASWLGPLMMLLLVKRYVERPRYLTALSLAPAVVFSFILCEYYTYFGGIFACVFGLAILYGQWLEAQKSDEALKEFKSSFHFKVILPQIGLSILVLALLMILLFPSLVHPYDKNITFKARGLSEFNLFSLRNPASLFAPGLEFLKDVIPYKRLGVKGEMTFRLGIFFWAGLIYLLKSSWASHTNAEKTAIKALSISGLVNLLFAFTPGSFPWLSQITLHFFPMFRVGVRSVLFTDLAAIFILGITLTGMFREGFNKKLWVPILVTFIAFWDVQFPERGLFGAYKTHPLPPTYPTLETLAAAPPGWVLEIPMWSNQDIFEFDSDQNYRRIQHHKKLVNIVRGHHNSPYTVKINALTQIINQLDSEMMSFARQTGVLYFLVASYMDTEGLNPYIESGEIELMKEDEKFYLYLMKSPKEFSKSSYMSYLDSLESDKNSN